MGRELLQVDYEEAIFLWRVDKKDFLLWLAASSFTLSLGIEVGVLIGVRLSTTFLYNVLGDPEASVLFVILNFVDFFIISGLNTRCTNTTRFLIIRLLSVRRACHLFLLSTSPLILIWVSSKRMLTLTGTSQSYRSYFITVGTVLESNFAC